MKLLHFLLFGIATTATALVPQAGDTTPGPHPFENMGQVWLALIVLLGTIFNHFAQVRRERLQRKWLLEDRDHIEAAAAITAERARREFLREQERVSKQLEENTSISRGAAVAAKDAYDAANNLNMKIAAVGGVRRTSGGDQRASDSPSRGRKVGSK